MVKFGKRGNERANDVLSGGEESVSGRRKASRRGAVVLAVTLFLVAFALVLAATFPFRSAFTVALAVVAGLALAGSVHIAYEWERAVVLRFGRFHRLAGPGLYVSVPVVDSVTIVIDQRISSISCSAEQVLTADLVPVDLDAVVFWMVWDPKKACLAVDLDAVVFWMVWDPKKACLAVKVYEHSASLVAQTALRDAIGQVEIAELSMQRAHIDHQLKKSIEEKTEQWGVTINDVEIRDIRMPQELQNAMSAEAQAQQERNARVVLAEVEKDISDMFIEAAHAYREDDLALQLRMMSLVNESVKEGGNMVVVPSPYAQGFTGDIASALKGKK